MIGKGIRDWRGREWRGSWEEKGGEERGRMDRLEASLKCVSMQ